MTTSARDDERDPRNASIADPYWDLLAKLDDGRRQGMVRRLAVGFYEGWLPSREEVAILVDFELGRISEAEFFASKRPTGNPDDPRTRPPSNDSLSPSAAAVWGTRRPAAARVSHRTGPGTMRPTPIAAFNVDCGELAPPFRLIASRLYNVGATVRDGTRYRLMSLHYELVPSRAGTDGMTQIPPVLFTGAIVCVPDIAAPWAEDDGRVRRHTVRTNSISGSRGMWPVAENAQRVSFLITGQPPPGSQQEQRPTGTLRVDVVRGSAVWRRTGGPSGSRAAQQ